MQCSQWSDALGARPGRLGLRKEGQINPIRSKYYVRLPLPSRRQNLQEPFRAIMEPRERLISLWMTQ